MHRVIRRSPACVAAVLAVVAAPSVLATTFNGTTTAFFSNPVLSGDIVDPATGATTPTDNTTTAACDLSGCPVAIAGDPTTTLAYGITPGSSVITFTPKPISADSGQVFDFGTVTFTNATSSLASLIFGADLNVSFDLTGTTKTINPKVIHIGITTTNNTGTVEQNADFLSFPANLDVTFNVLEGATASAELTGKIIGDPEFQLVDLVLNPQSVGLGFIGHGLVGVPEPSSVAIFVGALGGLGVMRRRARSATPRTPA